MKTDTGIALVDLDEEGVDRAFRADVLKGLNQLPKAIPARWFYDQEGSRLFERITQLDEYYPTRAETDILKTRSNEFAQLVGQGRAVVEFGSGSSVKTPLLLEAIEIGMLIYALFYPWGLGWLQVGDLFPRGGQGPDLGGGDDNVR